MSVYIFFEVAICIQNSYIRISFDDFFEEAIYMVKVLLYYEF